MPVGPSMWWPTPAEPTRWFEAGDIVASRTGLGWSGLSRSVSSAGSPLRDPRLDELATLFGLAGVEFVVVPGNEINASSSGLSVSVHEATLRQPVPVREWLIAHELAHIRLGHGRKLFLLTAMLWLMTAAAVVLIHVPAGVATGAVLFAGHRWVSRAFERQADITASKLVNRPDIRDLTEMALRSHDNLAPSMMRRVMRRHPAPAERLELLSRL